MTVHVLILTPMYVGDDCLCNSNVTSSSCCCGPGCSSCCCSLRWGYYDSSHSHLHYNVCR